MINRFTIFLFIGTLLFSCADGDDTQKQRFLIRGNNALAQQNYREAQRLYQEALTIDSCYSPALNNLGILRFEQGQHIQSILAYDAALACNPEDYEALLNRTNAYYETNQLFRAEDDLEYLLRKNPDSVSLYFRLGLVHAKMHKYVRALGDFTQALDGDPANAEALINRGSTYYYLGKFDNAEADLIKAEAFGEELGNIYNALALVSIGREEYDTALMQIEQALREEPLQPYFLNNRGFILLLKGEMDLAREDIDRSITLDSDNAWAYRNKGRWYHANGQYEDALRLYALALTKDTFVESIHIFIGETHEAMGDISAACRSYAMALEENDPSAEAHLEMCNR